MLVQQIADAIGGAALRDLDQVARTIWKAHDAGLVGDDDAQRLAELLEARRVAARTPAPAPVGLLGRRSYFPPKAARKPLQPPQRAEAMARRRRLAASGAMPPALACRFTTGELAVLRIVADEVRDRGGRCSRTVAEIAARAGVGVSTARNAIRTAARLGLLTVEERRQRGRPNLANVVRVISREWLAWIARRGGGIGFKNSKPTEIKIQSDPKRSAWTAPSEACARPG